MNAAQLPLPDAPRFDGESYLPWRDDERLTGQLLRVWNAMNGGRWWTLRQLAETTGDPEASISAQMRHLRKDRFGRHTVEKDHLGNGLYRYRLIVNPDAARIIAAALRRKE